MVESGRLLICCTVQAVPRVRIPLSPFKSISYKTTGNSSKSWCMQAETERIVLLTCLPEAFDSLACSSYQSSYIATATLGADIGEGEQS